MGDGTEVAVGAVPRLLRRDLQVQGWNRDWFIKAKMASPTAATAIPEATTATLVEPGESSIFLIRSDKSHSALPFVFAPSSFGVPAIGGGHSRLTESELYMGGWASPTPAHIASRRGRTTRRGVSLNPLVFPLEKGEEWVFPFRSRIHVIPSGARNLQCIGFRFFTPFCSVQNDIVWLSPFAERKGVRGMLACHPRTAPGIPCVLASLAPLCFARGGRSSSPNPLGFRLPPE